MLSVLWACHGLGPASQVIQEHSACDVQSTKLVGLFLKLVPYQRASCSYGIQALRASLSVCSSLPWCTWFALLAAHTLHMSAALRTASKSTNILMLRLRHAKLRMVCVLAMSDSKLQLQCLSQG